MSSNGGAMVVHDQNASGNAPQNRPPKKKRPPQKDRAVDDMVVHDPNASGKKKSRPPPKERAVDDDDVSDVSGDYDQEAGEEEPRFKYSTAELADNSLRNTKCCIVAMCILCIIVAVVLSIVMTNVQDDADEKNKEDTEAPTVAPEGATKAPGTGLFNAPQAFVGDRCAADLFASDPNICVGLCNGFDCCGPLLGKNESCFNGNREGCLNFAPCHVLDFSVDPPPRNLESICSPDQVLNDRTECELKCLNVECCWSDSTSCVVDNFYACVDYAPCQHLRQDLIVPLPQDTIQNLCNPEETGSVSQTGACEEACAPAECCWSESDNCLQSNFFTCLAYEDCKKLVIPPVGEVVATADEEINTMCTPAKITEGDATACENACSPGDCCAEGASDNCFTADPLSCLSYDVCKVLL